MRGVLTIIPVGSDAAVTRKELTAVPRLPELQAGVGGNIEIVPGLIRFEGEPCAAFCNEEGKLQGLPVNTRATELWYEQVGDHYDWLDGPIVIVTGDKQLMEEL